MNEYRILYDKIWLYNYIDQLKNQRKELQNLKEQLWSAKYYDKPETCLEYDRIMLQIDVLNSSLQQTEIVLEQYYYNVQNAALQLQEKCTKIEFPDMKLSLL